MSNEDGGKDILTEIIETASEYVSEDLEEKVHDAVRRAIIDMLKKYGRNVNAPIFVDETSGEAVLLDNGTPRGARQITPEFIEQLLSANLSVVNTNTPSPTNLKLEEGENGENFDNEQNDEQDEENDGKDKKGKKNKKEKNKKDKKGKLDRLIDKQDGANEKLNKFFYATFLNQPGVSQLVTGRQMKYTVVSNNDQKPIPVVLVTDLNRSESKKSRKERLKKEKKEKEELKSENAVKDVENGAEEPVENIEDVGNVVPDVEDAQPVENVEEEVVLEIAADEQ